MKRVWLALVCAALAFGSAVAEDAAVAAYAKAQEARIAEQAAKETTPRRRLEMEYLLRQDYGVKLERERAKKIRSGTLRTDETEALRAERQALLKQVEALDEKIAKASEKAPEIVALDAVRAANSKRLDVLRNELLPPSMRKANQAAPKTE